MQYFLDFEKPLVELEQKSANCATIPPTVSTSPARSRSSRRKPKSCATRSFESHALAAHPLARHQNRPYTLDYVRHIFTDWSEVHGDRNFRDDPALVCGFARFDGEPCMVIGHQKGRDTKEKVYRNFGMPNPEGYRKALRVMQMASSSSCRLHVCRYPRGFPGIGAEERGQAEAIARNLREMAALSVPIIVTLRRGWLRRSLGDRRRQPGADDAVFGLRVISPEGCAAILWSDGTAARKPPRPSNSPPRTSPNSAR